MVDLPDRIENVEQLEQLLARPSEALVETVGQLDGDIMVLGAGGKIGPSLVRRAHNAVKAAGLDKTVYAVDLSDLPELAAEGVETIACDLLDLAAVEKLPKVKNIVFMAGRKFGSTGAEHLTWAINVVVPYHVARTFTESRIAAFSTGCVYPVMHLGSGGAVESTPPAPVGEYAMSCLGRERMFEVGTRNNPGQSVVNVRLNYAVECRYGVLVDVARRIAEGQPVDVTTGYANVIWQGDACDQALRCLTVAANPATAINITGPETFSIRQAACEMARMMGREASFSGEENFMGYLNNAARAAELFCYPEVPLERILKWTADWVAAGRGDLGKPTHFETQDGKY